MSGSSPAAPAVSADIVVLGAGPAGLGAAWRLARTGRSVVVLERAPFVGGLSASFDVAGVRVDHGSHRLHPNTPAPILADLRDLLGADLQLRPRHGRIRLAGAFVPFPPRPAAMVRALPPSFGAGLVIDALGAPLRRPATDTFAEVVRAGLGPTMLDRFYAPFVHKLFGVPATALDGELARRRVSASGPAGLLRKALRRGEQGNVFWYPRRGYGQITDALADAGVDAGARIECDTTVTAVTVASDGVQVHATSPQGSRAFTASAVWSTVPVPVLSALTEGPAPRVRHRAMVLLYLVLPQVRWTEFDAHYLPGPEVPATRISEPRNYRDSADDPPDRTVLCVEWPCAVDDDVWTASPDALVARLRRAMAPQDLVIPEPIAVEVRRIAHAYPVYDLGFAERLAPTLAHLDAQLPRVVTFGRNGLFAHDNAHHALATAYAAVRCLANRDVIDVAAWRRELAGFARHVVED